MMTLRLPRSSTALTRRGPDKQPTFKRILHRSPGSQPDNFHASECLRRTVETIVTCDLSGRRATDRACPGPLYVDSRDTADKEKPLTGLCHGAAHGLAVQLSILAAHGIAPLERRIVNNLRAFLWFPPKAVFHIIEHHFIFASLKLRFRF